MIFSVLTGDAFNVSVLLKDVLNVAVLNLLAKSIVRVLR